jgi:hypothetical protein
MKHIFLLTLLLLSLAAYGQKISVDQVGWLTGVGAPSATCSAVINNGAFYTDSGSSILYQCYPVSSVYTWHAVSGSGGPFLPLTGGTLTGPLNAPVINSVGNPSLFAGATADVQINACLAVYNVCDGRSYGATSQTIAATVAIGAYPSRTLILSPETYFAPSTSSPPSVMFKLTGEGILKGLHVVLPSTPLYNGLVIQVADTTNINSENPLSIQDILIDGSAEGSLGGTCLSMAPPLNGFIQLVNAVDGFTCVGLYGGVSLSATGNSSGLGYISGVTFNRMVLNAGVDLSIAPATAAYTVIDSNVFNNVQLEGTGVELNFAGAGAIQGNVFTNMIFFDAVTPVANSNTTCALFGAGNTGACQNIVMGNGVAVTTAMDPLSANSAYPNQNIYDLTPGGAPSKNFNIVNIGGVASPQLDLHTITAGTFATPLELGTNVYNYANQLYGFAGFLDSDLADFTPAYQIQIGTASTPVLTVDQNATVGIGNGTIDPTTGLISADPFTVTQAGAVKAASLTTGNVNIGGVASPQLDLHTITAGTFATPIELGTNVYNYANQLYGFAGFLDSTVATATPAYQIQIGTASTPGMTIDRVGTVGIGSSTIDSSTGLISADPFTVTQAGAVKAASLTTGNGGTFVCTGGGDISVVNTAIDSTSDITISMSPGGNSGTITTPPAFKTVTAGAGFHALCGAADTSTYRYRIWN